MSAVDVALIGLGLHARRSHYHLLEELAADRRLRLRAVIDLADQEAQIRLWLRRRRLVPEQLLFLDPAGRDRQGLDPRAEQLLHKLAGEGLTHLLVTTEPKAHKAYLMWGARAGLSVLCEKPLTAFDQSVKPHERGARIVQDYLDIEAAARTGGGRILVMAPRRVHEGFKAAFDLVAEFVREHGAPMTLLDIYHADGMWNMPDEFFSRENHPYKYGYGKLLHSGYHHVDLAARFLGINNLLSGLEPDSIELFGRQSGPADFFAQTRSGVYRRLLHTDRFDAILDSHPDDLSGMGETDVLAIGQVQRRQRTLTNLVLTLTQTSVSGRNWPVLPPDLASGRVIHERMTIHIGHLATVHTHSYRGVSGHPDGWPFTLQVFRNSNAVGGSEYEEFTPIRTGPSSQDLNAAARRAIVEAWIAGQPVDCELGSHMPTITLMAMLYDSLYGYADAGPGLVTRPWP